jgi:hypothetical protein
MPSIKGIIAAIPQVANVAIICIIPSFVEPKINL